MVNTHHDFGPVIEGKQERYLSYYGIRRSILDGAMEIQIITAIQRLTMPLSRQR